MKLKTKTIAARTSAIPQEFRILVCGSRDWTDIDTINLHLNKLIVERGVKYSDVLVITGSVEEDNNGADSLIDALCRTELGIACMVIRPAWKFYDRVKNNRRAAGPERNRWMLRWGRPDYVLAFHPYLPGSRGTKHMVGLAREANIPVRIVEK